MPRITVLPWYAGRSYPGGSAMSYPANDTRPCDTCASTRFMGGEPMNAPTNRFAGCM